MTAITPPRPCVLRCACSLRRRLLPVRLDDAQQRVDLLDRLPDQFALGPHYPLHLRSMQDFTMSGEATLSVLLLKPRRFSPALIGGLRGQPAWTIRRLRHDRVSGGKSKTVE